jgi:hypothetical protein
MARRYAISHRTTGRYLAVLPSLAPAEFDTVVDPKDGVHFSEEWHAEEERAGLGEFRDAWQVVPVQVEMMSDLVDSEETIRKREQARGL